MILNNRLISEPMHISIHYQMRLTASGSTHLRHSKAELARTPHAVGLHFNREFLPSPADASHGSVEKSVHRGFTVSCKPRFSSVCRVFKQLSQGHSSPISGHSSFHVISWNKFVDISWQASELIRCRGLDFPHLAYCDCAKQVKFVVSGHLMENAWEEWPEI